MLKGGAGGGWRWTVSEYKCFPVLSAAVGVGGGGPAAAAAAVGGGQ